MNIYQATHLAQLQSHVDPETGEFDKASFDAAQITARDKQLAYAAFIRNDTLTINAMKEAENELTAKRKNIESRRERMKLALADSMKATNETALTGDRNTFTVKLYLERDSSVEVDPGAIFPAEYYGEPKPPEISKTKLKAAIEAGAVFPGARIVKKDRLEVK